MTDLPKDQTTRGVLDHRRLDNLELRVVKEPTRKTRSEYWKNNKKLTWIK